MAGKAREFSLDAFGGCVYRLWSRHRFGIFRNAEGQPPKRFQNRGKRSYPFCLLILICFGRIGWLSPPFPSLRVTISRVRTESCSIPRSILVALSLKGSARIHGIHNSSFSRMSRGEAAHAELKKHPILTLDLVSTVCMLMRG